MSNANQMLEESEKTAPIELARLDKDKYFRIHSKLDILAIMRTLMEKRSLVTLYFDRGSRFILTSILEIDSEKNKMVIDYGADEAVNQCVLGMDRLTFISSQDRIKIEFVCKSINKTQLSGRDAFVVDVPDSVVRMQRRDSFRMTIPVTRELKCSIPLPSGHDTGKADVAVLDISCGGIALIDHHPKFSFDLGAILKNCQITLPSLGTITATIQVKNTYKVTLPNGLVCNRVGCEFVTLPTRMSGMIQRYVIKLEQASIRPASA